MGDAGDDSAWPAKGQKLVTVRAISLDLFKWIVTGLLGALFAAVGWFMGGIQSDLREMRKEVAGIRIDTAVATTKLEGLIAEIRRRESR